MSGGDWKDLYQAAVEGNLALLRYRLKEGVNPNYQHPEVMRTPLVASIVEGHAEVARHLLECGADPNLVSELDNMTPLQAARHHGHDPIVQLLQTHGAQEVPSSRWTNWWRRHIF